MSNLPQNGFEAIDNPIHPALQTEGITPELLAKKLKEELEATEIKVFRGYAVEGVGEEKEVKGEEVIYSKPLIAWKIRQEARKDAHKLLSHYPSDKIDITDTRMVQAILAALPPDIQESVEEMIKLKVSKKK